MYSILDYEIYVPDPSHFMHNSLIDGAQPSDFHDVFLAISSPISVFPLTILDLMCFCISYFVPSINPQSLFEYFEHLLPSSFHTSTTKDSLSVYSHESTTVLICDILDSLEAISTHGVHAFTLFYPMPFLCSYNITCTHPLCVNEDGDMIFSLGQLFHLSGAHFISTGLKFNSYHQLGADYKSQDPSILLSHHWISVVIHGPSFHPAAVLDLGEHISLLPKKKIPPEINI